MATNGTCDSCGRDGEALTEVRRVYVAPGSPDAEGADEQVTVVPEPEAWCFACLTHYPHQRVDEHAGDQGTVDRDGEDRGGEDGVGAG